MIIEEGHERQQVHGIHEAAVRRIAVQRAVSNVSADCCCLFVVELPQRWQYIDTRIDRPG
jgi:hypothetical protein